MGNSDSVPIISQIKSLVQVINGDLEGAKETQKKFLRTNPFSSPWVQVHYRAKGNEDEALKVAEEFANSTLESADGMSFVDHVVGLGFLINGDHERGETVLKGTTAR